MRYRTDSQLRALLRELHERAQASIADHIWDALEMMGTNSPYKGGKRLVEQLETVVREADAASDPATAEGIRDAIAYVTGRLLGNDITTKYQIYDDSG